MKTLEDVKRAAELADKRSRLIRELAGARVRRLQGPGAPGQRVSETEAFGVSLDHDLLGQLRMVVIAELHARLQAVETELRELGVTLPGDPVPVLEPATGEPTEAFVIPQSWDPNTREFSVYVPCRAVKSVRWADDSKGSAGREVDVLLNPQGLVFNRASPAPVVDVTSGSAKLVGKVIGVTQHERHVALDVRLLPGPAPMLAAVASGEIEHVDIEYLIEDEELAEREGERPLVTAHEWKLTKLRVRRTTAQAEAA
ncbi:hypothetical protein [Methylorubrum thiocyanatum]|uniref:hypothetical protein n=1 Tax=Methylorubrum thiocyanatum TaxID=47958 RepID=UPI003F7FEB82